MKFYSNKEMKDIFHANLPVAICDGGIIKMGSYFEIYMFSWFQSHGIEFEREEELYYRNDMNLSKYKTIVFDTQGGSSPGKNEIEDIMSSFSKDNLKLLVIGGEEAYRKVKTLAENLDIVVIVADIWNAWAEIEQLKEDFRNDITDQPPNIHDIWKKDFPEMFFDPKERWQRF